ncbi:hypothetical protein [Aeromonas sobria]|uniref:hypothetical protein n=1 Tax=Aeromonas TaxID=642 RepID=UPI0011E0095C|nr:hypothetical protein [Aeromonas sobria]
MVTDSDDTAEMTQKQLEVALDKIAAEWRKAPYLSNDFSEGVRYGEIRNALKERFGISKEIIAIDGPTDYHAV